MSILWFQASDYAGGKHSKEMRTVVLTASMTGEKLKPLVIAKSRQARCFKGILKTHNELQVQQDKFNEFISPEEGLFERNM